MREILFRGKTDNGEWIEGLLLWWHDSENVQITQNKKPPKGGSYTQYVIPETVGQNTGLTDKNGTKIFEGDILQTGTKRGYVLFGNGCFLFRWKNCDKHRPDFLKDCILTDYGSFTELEVIGNIYDNPELLKEAQG